MLKILVVDDEPDVRYLVRRTLERAGFEVTEAGNGAIAIQAIRESLPDLVVTDMMMPIMGGAELIRRLRADPVAAQIPILAVTGDSQLAGGADAVLSKPFRPAELLAAGNALLAEKVHLP